MIIRTQHLLLAALTLASLSTALAQTTTQGRPPGVIARQFVTSVNSGSVGAAAALFAQGGFTRAGMTGAKVTGDQLRAYLQSDVVGTRTRLNVQTGCTDGSTVILEGTSSANGGASTPFRYLMVVADGHIQAWNRLTPGGTSLCTGMAGT